MAGLMEADVAVVGLGILGAAVARRLLAEGMAVSVWSRTQHKRSMLESDGAQAADTVVDAVQKASVIVLLLSDYTAINHTVLSEPCFSTLHNKTSRGLRLSLEDSADTVATAHRPREFHPRITITQGINYASGAADGYHRSVAEPPHRKEAAGRRRDVRRSSYQVQGSQAEALRGELQVMVGAHADDVPTPPSLADRVLACLGKQRTHVGPVGSAAALKLCMNQVLAAETVAFATSLQLVQSSGVPTHTFMSVLKGSAMFARQFEKKLPNMVKHDYYDNANFHTTHLLKDIRLFATEAAAAGLNTKAVEGLAEVTEATMEAGFESADYSSVYEGIGMPALPTDDDSLEPCA